MNSNGQEIAKALYQPTRKKKRKRKRIEKVTAPEHWSKDFDSHEQKLKQRKNNE
jgi:hypothetical protein